MITKDGERNPNSGKSKAEQASNKGQKKKNTGTGNKGSAPKSIPSASTSTPKTTPSSSTSGSLTTPKTTESQKSSSSSSGSSDSSRKKKTLSAEEKSKALSDLMDRATIGSSRTYGLSFQSSANRKISDAESKRKQTLVEQATKNGYLVGQNTKQAQNFRNTVNQKLERAISSGKSPSEARADEQQRIRTQRTVNRDQEKGYNRTVSELNKQIAAIDSELAPLKNKIEGRYPVVSEKSGKTKEALTEERSKLIQKKKDVTGDYGVLDSIYNSLEAGAGQFNSGVTSTLNAGKNVLMQLEAIANGGWDKETGKFVKGDAPFFGSLFQPVSDLNQSTKDTTAQFAQKAATGWNQYGKGGNLANQLIQGTVSAVPNAVLAMATAGGSTAATLAPEASGLTATVADAVQKLSKDPMYWTSFVQSFGNSYDEAIEKGATEDEALLATLLSSTANAIVEVGGGVEQLPGELRKEGLTSKDKIRKWVSSSLDEGKEEVVQGMIERLVNKAVYNQDAPWNDDTGKNEDAVFNLDQSLKEFGMGTAIGGILGGGQMLAQGIAARGQRIVDPTASPWDQAMLDTYRGVQTPENVTQVREPTELDNIVMAAMNQNKNTSADVAEVQQKAELPKVSMEDFANNDSPIWRNVEYGDTDTKTSIMQQVHKDMVERGEVVQIPAETVDEVSQYFPDMRNVSKKERVPVLRQKMNELKGLVRGYLNTLKGVNYEFEVDGNILDAKLYDTGIKEVMEKVTKDKGGMLLNSDQIFKNAQYLYSSPDYDGNSNVQRWNYFYTPIQAGDETLGVRIAVRDMKQTGVNPTNSQIYNWNIKKDATLGGGRSGETPLSSGTSSAASSNQNVAQSVDSVNRENVGTDASTGAAPAGFDPLSHASNQYGAIEPGENPTRVVDFPVSMDGETKVGQFSRTMAEAGVTTQQAYEAIENLVAQNRMSHEIATDDAALEHASATISTQMIDGMSIESVRSQFIREASEGKATKDLAARGFLLYEQAVREGNGSAVIDLAVAMNDVATNAGQALQAQRMLKKLTPEWRLQAIQRSVSTINENLRNKAGSKYNQDAENIRLDDALVTEYLQADSDAARDEVVGKMQKQIASQIPSTLGERWNDMRYLNMLGNFKTQVRNITGNVGAQGLREIKNKVAWAGEGLTYLLSGKKFDRTKAFFVNESLMDAAYKTFDQYADVAMGDAKFRDTGNTGNDFLKGVEEARQGQVWTNADGKVMNTKVGKVAGKVLQGYHNVTDFAMNEFGDKPFSKFAFARSLAGWLKVHNITAEQWNSDTWLAEGNNRELADRGIQYAIKEAQESTFRETNAVSKWVAGIGRGKNTPWAVRVASEGTIPFRKTPANVLVQMERFSPLGVINTIAEGVKVKNGEATGADVINAAAEALTGTGLMWLGFGLAKAGILRGKKDDPQDELEGHQSYALELADKMLSYTIDWFASTSVPLLIGAQIYELSGKDNIEAKDFGDALLSIADPLIETSMLSSVNDTLSQLRYSDANMGQILVTMAANYVMQGLTSTLMGQIERTFEKTRQQTYLDPDSSTPIWMQSLLGKMSQKVPGWDYQQADYIDQWGRTEDNGSLGKRAFNNFLNPGYSSKINVTDVDTEIRRLEQQTGEDYTPSTVPKYVNVKNADGEAEKVYLDAEQYNAYRTTKGQTDFALRQAFLENETYQGLPANVQGKIQRYCEKYADELGKKAAVNDYQISDGFKDYNDMTQEEVMEDLILRAVGEEKYISDEAKNKLGNVQKLYDSLAYAGVSDDLKESAREKAAAYFQDAEKAKFGYELSEEQQKLAGKNQKTLAEYFLDEAVKAKYKDANKDGTNRDELLQAYNDNELNDRTAIAVLSAREVDAYQKFGKAAGVTPQMMLEASSAHARMHEVKDNDGIVTSSVQNQYDDWLDSRNLTEEQKKALRMGFYGDTVDTYNKLVEDLDLGNITVGEAKQELSPTYQYGWTHNVSSTGVQMRDYISSMATFENAPTEEERDKMGFDSKWEWFCNELNKNTELTKEQKYAIAISTDRSMKESTKKKIANKLGTAYVAPTTQTDGSGASSTAGSGSGSTAVTSTESAASGSDSYASSGTGGGTFSGWSSDAEEKSQAQKAYERFGMAAGATEAMYTQAKAALKNIETVYDMDGNVVRSAEDQFDSWLERRDWTEDQKDAVRAGFYADSVKNLQYLSSELREGNISVAAAKSELSAKAQTGWTRSVMDTGVAMADYIDAWAQFKEAPSADERDKMGFGTKWAWFCDYLNQTDMTAEQKYAIAVSVQDYAESTRKKIQKNVGWDGVSSAEQEPQEETYDIRTDDGYREYLSLLLKRKDRYEAKDGSVWTLGADGDVVARTKDGRQLRVRAVLGRNGFDDEPGDGYTVGSKAGQLAYKMMQNGVMKTWDAPDGWTWKLVRGEIIAEKNGTKIPVRMAG